MSEKQAVTTIPVSRTCEDKDCQRPAEVSTIVTGEYGVVTEAIAVYCEPCAADRDGSDAHRAIGEVTHE